MTGILQPLDNKFAIVDRHGNPTDYFIRWAQQKQIDIGSSITLTDLANYLAAHKLASGQGIALTPDGNLADSPSISVLNGTGLDFDVMHNLKLADTAVVPGTYGDATHVPAIVVDQQGRITGVTLVAISGGGGGGGPGTLLSTQTVAGVASVVFDNTKITGTYDNYLVRWRKLLFSTSAAAGQIQLSPDNGVTWRVTGYNNSFQQWGLTTAFQSYNQNLLTSGLLQEWSAATDATILSNGEMEIFGLPSASLKKTSMARAISKGSDNNLYNRLMGGEYTVGETHNAIRVIPTAGTISGTFTLWGIA
jgi:hypothetical protein